MSRLIFTLSVLILAAAPAVAWGQETLVTLPGFDGGEGISGFINALYAISITIAGLLAVVKIVIAGVKWMLSDVTTGKEQAKKDIYGALIGLFIVLGAVLILTIINPNITEFDSELDPVEPTGATGGGTSGAGAGGGSLDPGDTVTTPEDDGS